MAKKTGKSFYLVAFALLFSSVGYLAASGFSENALYELSVADITSVAPEKQKAVRLSGKIIETTPFVINNTPAISFLLTDEQGTAPTLRVVYTGAVPDMLKPGAEVIIEGGYDVTTKSFNATRLMTKCPSKYDIDSNG